MLPLATTLVMSVSSALLFLLPLLGRSAVLNPSGPLLLVGCLAAGVLVVVAAVSASSPMLRRVAGRLRRLWTDPAVPSL